MSGGPSDKQRKLMVVIEQAISALVNDDEFVYFVFVMPREIETADLPWSHASNAPLKEVGGIVGTAVLEKYLRITGEQGQ
jgi:hypothetical protein